MIISLFGSTMALQPRDQVYVVQGGETETSYQPAGAGAAASANGNIRNATVTVFSDIASVRFTSRHTAGNHFVRPNCLNELISALLCSVRACLQAAD